MTIEDIKQMRAQLPQNWEWRKCYELAYRDFFSDRQTIKRHWALKDPEDLKGVASLGTVSINKLGLERPIHKGSTGTMDRAITFNRGLSVG